MSQEMSERFDIKIRNLFVKFFFTISLLISVAKRHSQLTMLTSESSSSLILCETYNHVEHYEKENEKKLTSGLYDLTLRQK